MNPYLWQRRYQPHQTLNKPYHWRLHHYIPTSEVGHQWYSSCLSSRDTGCPTPPSPINSWFLGYKFATVFGYSSNINCISSQIEFVTQYCRWQVSLKLSVPVSRFRELVMQGQSTLYNTAQQWVIQHSGPSYIPVGTIDHTGGWWALLTALLTEHRPKTYLTLAADDGDQFDWGRNMFC